jgi:hypothetical protein
MVVFKLGHTRIMEGRHKNSDNARQKKGPAYKYAEGEGRDMYDTRGGRPGGSTWCIVPSDPTNRTGIRSKKHFIFFLSREISRRKLKQAVTERAQHDGQRGERSSPRGTGFTFASPGTAREPAGWRWGNAPG